MIADFCTRTNKTAVHRPIGQFAISKTDRHAGKRKQTMKEEREARRRRKKIKALIRLGVFLGVILLAVFFFKAQPFDVTEYIVEGNEYYTDDEVLMMGNCQTGGNIFIGTDYSDIKTRLKKDPYFEGVKVRIVFPNKVRLEIEERAQVGAVVYGENLIVIDKNGIMLRKTSVEPKLTVISGITLTDMQLGSKLKAEDQGLLDNAIMIVNTMPESDMYFKELDMKKGIITVRILDNLILKGTATNIIEVMQSGDLNAVVKELFSREIERGTLTVSGDNYISFNPKILD